MQVLYTKDHEWIRVSGDEAEIGITLHAAEQLGDIVYVELPEPGRQAAKGEEIAVVESVKAASDVYAPVSGEVLAVNPALSAQPETVNGDPEGAGWFLRLRLADASELDGLMDKAAYDSWVALA